MFGSTAQRKKRQDGGERSAIDFHSHILPKMDDGSKSTEMSLRMLRASGEMGVGVMVATPHFYGYREDIAGFLKRRDASWQRLSQAMDPDGPEVLLGAEVAFYSGLLKLDGLDKLCVNGTATLLLEMPFAPWSGYELDTVSTLCLNRGYQVVLAHFERYLDMQKDRRLLESLLDLPLWIQINAEALLPLTKRGKWLEMFRTGQAHLLGSDCHNLDSRPPDLGQARAVLQKKLGSQILNEIDACGRRLLDRETGADGE